MCLHRRDSTPSGNFADPLASTEAALTLPVQIHRHLPNMLHRLVAIAALCVPLVLPASAAEPVSKDARDGVAIGGMDTVSYHDGRTKKSPVVAAGGDRFEVEHLGAKWRFASRQSADRFAASPAAFVPRYNGHCANALALGEGLIATDGSVWEFFGDRLHLFYAERGRQRWLKGEWRHYQAQADAAWQGLLKGQADSGVRAR